MILARRRLAAILAIMVLTTSVQAQMFHSSDSSSPEHVYTLEDALRLIRNDQHLQSAEQDVIIAQSRVSEAAMRFLPEFGLQASASKFNALYPFSLSENYHNILLFPNAPENIYSTRSYFNMPLYDGQRTLNTYRLALAAQKQALANRDSVKMDLTFHVKEAFYHLLLAQERATATAENFRTVRALATAAGSSSWDAVEAEGVLAGAHDQASETLHDLESARLTFLKSLNLELDTPFRIHGDLATSAVKMDVERAVLWAMELRPELQSQTYKAQIDSIGVSLANGRRYPTISVGGDYELTAQNFPLNKSNWDITIGVKIPLTYDLWSQLRQKRAEQRQGQLTRSDLQDQVRLEVRQAAENLRYWQEEWQRRDKQWHRIQELYDAASGKAGSALVRLRAQQNLLNSHLAYLAAVTEHLLARARFERAVGREITP